MEVQTIELTDLQEDTTRVNIFADVALLITVYNRSASLERLLNAFQTLGIHFGEIIVSDDCSKTVYLKKIKELQKNHRFKLVTTPQNKGLGNNINKGQAAVTKPFTLYVQEDFVPKPAFTAQFAQSLAILKADQSVDSIRYYSYFQYPYVKPYQHNFLEMVFKPSISSWNHLKFYLYSDHPHLRRTSFPQKFGFYNEVKTSDETEFDMALSFLKNNGKGLVYKYIDQLFDQKNSPDEPSTIHRGTWKNYDMFYFKVMRKFFLIYRYLKNNLQLITH